MLVAVTFCNQRERSPNSLIILDLETEERKIIPLNQSRYDIGATGITRVKDGYLVCMQGTRRIIKLNLNFEIVSEHLIETLIDAHSCVGHEDKVYAVSTGRDSILEINIPTMTVLKEHSKNQTFSDTLHMNGITMYNGEILSSHFGNLWRSHEKGAELGAIVNFTSGTTLLSNIAHPHSIVVHDNKVFFLGSYHGTVEEATNPGRKVLATLDGYLRGLVVGPWGAAVGASGLRRFSRSKKTLNEDVTDTREFTRITVFDSNWKEVKAIDLSDIAYEVYDIINIS